MPSLEKQFEEIDTVLLDMDGVVYVGNSLVKGAEKAIKYLRENGKSIIFLTNNSTKTRIEYKKKLSKLGISAKESEILTAAYATARYLSENFEEAKCYIVGESGLKEEIEKAGFETVSRDSVEDATHVIAGMDRDLTYDKVWGALTAILTGAEYIASNPDPTFPTNKGLAPGAGATIGAISGATQMEPSIIVGKPHSHMINAALDIADASPEKTAIIGDRLNTDIRAGNRENLTTVLVLTGVIDRGDVEEITNEEDRPDYIIESLEKLID